eukprot:CAMPEP_0175137760 /NCGR_PEP_ID=MMETSP0087-20121206/9984_1 /TAXON_ID=136419 /ORGANISM="Unknown Unknown, Strain D1" /LENGTH=338 /DNA_ID=CAMNT_0016420611 /DNA_START=100 /DNA_END=1116 /DNA_ORIENTATION=+
MLAGMNVAAGPKLAAAVTNAGGLGVIGGVNYTPDQLRKTIQKLKSHLVDKNAPFGVDLLLPQVGGSARKTNYDYTKGTLPALVDIIIEEKASLFVSAVGVPPKYVVDKMHAAGIPIMNMIGHPKHALKAIEVGVDMICAQGGEGGGHTGDVATSILIPAVVDICKDYKSPLLNIPIPVVAAGGISDGRTMAMALCLGAQAVWVGTRFVASKEAGAPPRHKNGVVKADFSDTIRSVIYTGRPMRVIKSPFIMDWNDNKQALIRELTAKGVLPIVHFQQEVQKSGEEVSLEKQLEIMPLLCGAVAGRIDSIKSAQEIVDEMVTGASEALRLASSFKIAKL